LKAYQAQSFLVNQRDCPNSDESDQKLDRVLIQMMLTRCWP